MNVASRLPNASAPLAERPGQSVKPPFLGFGLGLRAQHYDEILGGNPPIDWFEVISENYMLPGGQPLRMLDRICERYPVVMHGVSLSIASTAPPNFEYLQGLKDLVRRVEPKWMSDHLCWTGVHGKNCTTCCRSPTPMKRSTMSSAGSSWYRIFSAAPSCSRTSPPMSSSTIAK